MKTVGCEKMYTKDENVFAYYRKEDTEHPLGTLRFEPEISKLLAWLMISQGGYKYFLTFNLFCQMKKVILVLIAIIILGIIFRKKELNLNIGDSYYIISYLYISILIVFLIYKFYFLIKIFKK